jgi:hypothetical protein
MAETKDKTQENEVTLAQFKRNLSHVLISKDEVGPELTLGDTVLTFKAKSPVDSLVDLVGMENRVAGMTSYIRKALKPGQDEAFSDILGNIDMEGLVEIVNALSEAYTSFPDKS